MGWVENMTLCMSSTERSIEKEAGGSKPKLFRLCYPPSHGVSAAFALMIPLFKVWFSLLENKEITQTTQVNENWYSQKAIFKKIKISLKCDFSILIAISWLSPYSCLHSFLWPISFLPSLEIGSSEKSWFHTCLLYSLLNHRLHLTDKKIGQLLAKISSWRQ